MIPAIIVLAAAFLLLPCTVSAERDPDLVALRWGADRWDLQRVAGFLYCEPLVFKNTRLEGDRRCYREFAWQGVPMRATYWLWPREGMRLVWIHFDAISGFDPIKAGLLARYGEPQERQRYEVLMRPVGQWVTTEELSWRTADAILATWKFWNSLDGRLLIAETEFSRQRLEYWNDLKAGRIRIVP